MVPGTHGACDPGYDHRLPPTHPKACGAASTTTCSSPATAWGTTAPARTISPGPTSYLLGDLPSLSGSFPADGWIGINPEINRLGLCYGSADGDPEYDPYCDIGPTDDTSGEGVPLTDSIVGFEDMMIFAMNFGLDVAKDPVAKEP